MSNIPPEHSDDLVDITDVPKNTVLRDWFEDGIRIIILRGPFSMNVYLGLSSDHPLAGFGYDDIPLDCHGGLTFAQEGDDKYLPKGHYWYGYDYAHAGDFAWYHTPLSDELRFNDDRQWSLGEIVKDSWGPIYDMKKLIKLAEKIAAN